MNNIVVKYASSKAAKRTGELYAKNLLKNKRSLKRILSDLVIGAHAEHYGDAFITWNPSDYDIFHRRRLIQDGHYWNINGPGET